MSTKNVHDFMTKARTDDALRARLKEITTNEPEATLATVVKIGAEAGFDFTVEECQVASKEVLERQHTAGKLSEEELRRVAGAAELKNLVDSLEHDF